MNLVYRKAGEKGVEGVRRRGRGQVCMLVIKLSKQMAPAST